MSSEREIVWLPKSLAIKVKEVDDVKAIEELILNHVAECKGTLAAEVDNMDDDIIQFRAHMIRAKNAFVEAKDVHLVPSPRYGRNTTKRLASSVSRLTQRKVS